MHAMNLNKGRSYLGIHNLMSEINFLHAWCRCFLMSPEHFQHVLFLVHNVWQHCGYIQTLYLHLLSTTEVDQHQ